jgi:hypothetical protein
MDERSHVVVYSLERFLMGVRHVAQLIVANSLHNEVALGSLQRSRGEDAQAETA